VLVIVRQSFVGEMRSLDRVTRVKQGSVRCSTESVNPELLASLCNELLVSKLCEVEMSTVAE
jgi:hypothetical protein